MNANPRRAQYQVRAQVDDRLGQFRWSEDAQNRQEVFDLELNAFESGCVMRWLERRWSRTSDLAGSSFVLHNSKVHIQVARPMGGEASLVPLGFEAWMRRIARIAD